MSLIDDLQKREQQAGNTPDNNDPHQQAYNEKFNQVARNTEDEDFDEIIAHNFDDSDSKEVGGDTVAKNYNSDSEREALQSQEENPDSLYSQKDSPKLEGRFGSNAKRYGASGGIIGIVLFALVIVSGGSTLLASSLLVNVKEVFHNDRSDVTRTSLMMTRAMNGVALRVNGGDPCTGKSKISCLVGTISRQTYDRYKNEGFRFEGDEIDSEGRKTGKNARDEDTASTSRYRLTAIIFPDGFRADSGKKYNDYIDRNVNARRAANIADNGRSSFYRAEKFTDTLVNRLKITNGKTVTDYQEGDDQDAQKQRDQQFNQSTGGVSSADAETDARRVSEQAKRDVETKSNLTGKATRAGSITALVQTVCSVYKSTKIATASVKSMHMIRLANFAMEFLKVADAIKDGVATATMVSYLADKLTYVERNEYLDNGEKNPKYNLSATDSQGYRIAAHGDVSGLTSFAERYVLGGAKEGQEDNLGTNILLGALAATTAAETSAEWLVERVGSDMDGKDVLKNICRSANSMTAIAAQCAATAAAMVATAPTIIGAIAGASGLKMCQCALLPSAANKVVDVVVPGDCEEIQALIDTAKGALIAASAAAVAKIIEDVVKNWNIGSDTKGVDAGNAIAAGVGVMLSTAATSYSLIPGTAPQYKGYIARTDPEVDKLAEVARLEAAEQPFDLENRYSFASQLAGYIGAGGLPNSITGFSVGSGILGIIPTSMKSLTSDAHGIFNQPVQEQSERYNCNNENEVKDEDLAYLGVDGDKFCPIITFTPDKQLDKMAEQAIDPSSDEFQKVREWMESEQKKPESEGGTVDEDDRCEKGCDGQASIDSNGKPNPDSQYMKYIENCTERQDPWGVSTHQFEEGSDRDQDWWSGKKCLQDTTMLYNFQMWHKICAYIAMANGTVNCWEENTTPPQSQGGDWVVPTTGPCLSPYGERWGAPHRGIDISPPSGTPIVAPTDMTITYSGYNSGGYGNMITAKADDGSNYSFRFGHMLSNSGTAGTKVKKGEQIGLVGSTGQSTGPHLHFEIFPPGADPATFSGAVDPVPILSQHGVTVSCGSSVDL